MKKLTRATVIGASIAAPSLAQAQGWQAIPLNPAGGSYCNVTAVRPGIQYGWRHRGFGMGIEAGFWRSSPKNWTPLNVPPTSAYLNAADGVEQVGIMSGRAVLWRGTSESRVELHPEIPDAVSNCLGVREGTQVGGVVLPFSVRHAALWHGTRESFVDLHPAGASNSYAGATDGVLQGGAVAHTGVEWRAAIWNSTPESMVELGPSDTVSEVLAMVPGVQVGYVYRTGGPRPAVWHGTAASFRDLTPPGITGGTTLYGTTGRLHVGQGFIGTSNLAHAVLSFDSATNWLDLHQCLSAPYTTYSQANTVYQDGPIIYVGGTARDAGQLDQAILWIGADPCYPNCDLSTAAPMLNVNDYVCFLGKFAAGDPYANCDQSSIAPILNVNDFVCFAAKFAAGCP